MTFSASIFASIFSSIFDGKWLPKPCHFILMRRAFWRPFLHLFQTSIFLCILVAPWLTFGSLLAPVGSLWAPLGSLLAPRWLHLGSLWLPFGSLRLHFGSFRLHFGPFWLNFWTFSRHYAISALILVPLSIFVVRYCFFQLRFQSICFLFLAGCSLTAAH